MGRASLNEGKYITSASTPSIAKYIGIDGFITSVIRGFPMLQPTNNTLPTGGVHSPTDRFRIIIMPNCNGEIPVLSMTCIRIGESHPLHQTLLMVTIPKHRRSLWLGQDLSIE